LDRWRPRARKKRFEFLRALAPARASKKRFEFLGSRVPARAPKRRLCDRRY
jgi:hypothetical protein